MTSAKDNVINLYREALQNGLPLDAMSKYAGASYKEHATGVKDGKDGVIAFFNAFIAEYTERDIEIIRALQDGDLVFLHVRQSLVDGNDQVTERVVMDFFKSDEAGKIIEHWNAIAPFSPANPSGRSSTDGTTTITDLDKTEANKALVKGFVEDCLIARKAEKVADYVSAKSYLQHNPKVPDGIEGLQTMLADTSRLLRYQSLVMMVGEGNFVATYSRAHWGDEYELCQADLFRVENGKIAEHWDVSERVPPAGQEVNSGKF